MNTTMADGAAQRLVAQIAADLFGQPGLTLMELAEKVKEAQNNDVPLGYVRVEAIKALREDDEVTGVMVHIEERADSVPVYLSAQPSPGGQDALREAAEFARSVLAEIYATYQVKIGPFASQAQLANVKLGAALAARQPVGELHLPPDGYYKIVYDDAEVPDESFARTGALEAALRRFEQISARWNAHLFVRFANNTRDCTVPNAEPAQAVDLDKLRLLGQRIEQVGRNAAPTAQGSGNVYFRNVIDWGRELLALIDGQAVGNG